ncbi:hypothetical protein [Streptomyces sp. NPDC059788]|uniref:hypothetical protein n=1 Tax=Streptomyces sp. NPDC059788 TaxID=3346948 RepID=UPI00365ACDFF
MWTALLTTLPVTYLPLPAGRMNIGVSCYARPEHVLLSERAFAHPAILAQQLLHELCHQRLYLCQELPPPSSPAPLKSPAPCPVCGSRSTWPPLRNEGLTHLDDYLHSRRTLLTAARPT